ncbi:MAG: trimethylamine methyltransferase family protein, partial [Caldilinea sp.]
ALQLARPLQIADDLPTRHLVEAQISEMHMITALHTLKNWENHLYLPGAVYDRKNREAWERAGGKTLYQRAVEEVEQRLATYIQIDTDPRALAEMERLIRTGLRSDAPLPPLPGPYSEAAEANDGRRQRRFRR